eukprot:Em0013g886a
MALSSLDALIQAAQFIEQNGGDSDVVSQQKKRTHRHKMRKPSTYSRTTHNLLEKNRRAQLRDCLEVLRQHVPLPDKLTTLALLQSAKKYIENLQVKERDENAARTNLKNEQSMLLSRLAELGAKSVLVTTPSKAYSPEAANSKEEDDESMAVDVESEDETSSITSGSDGGCTSTSHKFVANTV